MKIHEVDIGTEIHASDLQMPEGVTLATEGDTLICHMHD